MPVGGELCGKRVHFHSFLALDWHGALGVLGSLSVAYGVLVDEVLSFQDVEA